MQSINLQQGIFNILCLLCLGSQWQEMRVLQQCISFFICIAKISQLIFKVKL